MRFTVSILVGTAVLYGQRFPYLQGGIPAITSQPRCGGMTGMACSFGFVCRTDEGDCQGVGYCLPRPPTCWFGSGGVCGCDGVTYESSCKALQAGVSVDSLGACNGSSYQPTPVPTLEIVPFGGPVAEEPKNRTLCTSNAHCGNNQYCLMQGCDTEDGICANMPTYCPETDNSHLVCGCDGYTYSSVCELARAAANVASRGACPEGGPVAPEGAVEGLGDICWTKNFERPYCPKPEMFCVTKHSGRCRSPDPWGITGWCVIPALLKNCSKQPVCGCDGNNYMSDCSAWEERVQVDYYGECDAVPVKAPWGSPPPPPTRNRPCTDDSDCPDYEMFCNRTYGKCGGLGTCVFNNNCDKGYTSPVCGCDGVTYPNPCAAYHDKISLFSYGSCKLVPVQEPSPSSACSSDVDCSGGQFCDFADAACGVDPDLPGVCSPKPDCGASGTGSPAVAVAPSAPVCGCNWITYYSERAARCHGVSVRSINPCPWVNERGRNATEH